MSSACRYRLGDTHRELIIAIYGYGFNCPEEVRAGSENQKTVPLQANCIHECEAESSDFSKVIGIK